MPCVHELHRRLLEMLFGDWYVRLSDKDKLTTLTDLRDSFTREDIATELMRLTRDDAYSIGMPAMFLTSMRVMFNGSRSLKN